MTPENFTEVFGAGYTFERLTLQITNDKVTSTGVVSVLGPDFWKKRRYWRELRGGAGNNKAREVAVFFK